MLEQDVELREGNTLAIVFGEAPILLLAGLALAGAWWLQRRSTPADATPDETPDATPDATSTDEPDDTKSTEVGLASAP